MDLVRTLCLVMMVGAFVVADCGSSDARVCPVVQQVCVEGSDHHVVTYACPWGEVDVEIPGSCEPK